MYKSCIVKTFLKGRFWYGVLKKFSFTQNHNTYQAVIDLLADLYGKKLNKETGINFDA